MQERKIYRVKFLMMQMQTWMTLWPVTRFAVSSESNIDYRAVQLSSFLLAFTTVSGKVFYTFRETLSAVDSGRVLRLYVHVSLSVCVASNLSYVSTRLS